MSQENLNFNILLNGTYWDKLPKFSVWLDDETIIQDFANNDNYVIKFDRELAYGEHTLKIRLENKDKSDTVIENGEIVKDMLLNIVDVTIDDISLGNMIWSAEYQLDEPQKYQGKIITQLDNCVNLGWNGSYILKFSNPFYLWLLEKL